jgi:peptide/nickel transport system permease protein
MISYIARRLGWTLLVVWFVLTATFALAYVIPADPARAAVGPHADAAQLAAARTRLCLDRSLAKQYSCFVGRVVRGDLGTSFRTRRPVGALLRARAVPTIQLALAAVLLQVILGLPLGVLAGSGRLDRTISVLASIGVATPVFFLGPLLLYVVAYQLGWLPVAGYGGWRHLILPALTLAIPGAATVAQVTRAELAQTMREPFITAARAKGLGEAAVTLRHALRHALGPAATLVGLSLGDLLGGAILVEAIFTWPGLGREALGAVLQLDLPVILGVTLVGAIAVALANLLVDLAQLWIDPRVRR